MHRIPQYGMLVRAMREITHRREPMRKIREDFALPPTCDPAFLYTILPRTDGSGGALGGRDFGRRARYL